MWLQFVSRTPQAAPKNASSGPDWDKYLSLADMTAVWDQILWVFFFSFFFLKFRLPAFHSAAFHNSEIRSIVSTVTTWGREAVNPATRVRRCLPVLGIHPNPEVHACDTLFYLFLWWVLVAKWWNQIQKGGHHAKFRGPGDKIRA